ncbi:MAG: AAA family ATPase [Candidatus Poseidoniaceae archaeon]|uniref:Methanol dehydrogenase regulatory protein n=1 Tax=uncultured archaeon MedDCM-OCT-S02-C115 TaxID=743083 RepID=D6PAY5_9ARCH|nr:methanol dehydrogenase regulatory protein [uncultured archaeon MedDCM-OCT-S02-C115]|tara:strand:+ start:597 stop:1604 length:1008 start_codon:yes stop_codon:yes gene_type:complete
MNAGFQAGAPAGDHRTKDLIATVSSIANSLMGEVSKVIIGKNENLRRVTVGILSNGNMLLEDFPGLAKTLLANTFAQALGCKFKRVQFTPDLLPSDIMGTYMYDQKSGEFKLRAGPLFANILLADEINRAPPKTQAALLEAMEEKQVTIEGITHKLPAPFVVIATQNPIEQEGTYPLPEAQMDRFLMKMSMGYPDRAEEKAILARRKLRGKDGHDIEQITSPKKVVAMQKALETVHVDPAILSYIIEIVQRTREDHRVVNGASPRASQALFKSGRAAAAIDGRDYVIPDDIKGIALQIISHRINMKPEAKIRGITGMHIVRKILSEVPVPVIQQG